MNKLFLRALLPVAIFSGLLLVVYVFIGGDKAPFALLLFSLPWSVLLEVDSYTTGLSAFEIWLGEHYGAVIIGGLLLNALIIYVISALFLIMKARRHGPTSM